MSEENQNRAVARERLCRALASCYEAPDPSFPEDNRFEEIAHAATRLDEELADLARTLAASFCAEDRDALALDYSRLFVGAPRMLAPPYGSVWLDGAHCVLGVSTLGVIGLYRDGDFDLDDAFLEPPDHIVAELKFLHRLIARVNEAQRTGDAYALKDASDLMQRLLREHLARWVEPFGAAVKTNAQCAFYRHLTELTVRFVSLEVANDMAPSFAEVD